MRKYDPAFRPPPFPLSLNDAGTTYSCVGVFNNGQIEIVPNDQGNRITPSYVAFDPSHNSGGERLVGDAAKAQATMNPENTIFDIKRLIGRNFQDTSVQKDRQLFPFKVVNRNGQPHVQVCLCRSDGLECCCVSSVDSGM